VRPRAALVVALAVTGCATTLPEEARRAAEVGVSPEPLIERLADQWRDLTSIKRVFDVTLTEGRRRFAGEGVVLYRRDPRRLRLEVFGPHSTEVLRARLTGDSLTVVLPRSGEVLAGRIGDAEFARLAEEEALVSPEVLGSLLGVYDVERLVGGARDVAAARDGGRRTLYVVEDGTVHAFTLADETGLLEEYREARQGHLALRVRFEVYHAVDGRSRPARTVVRDFAHDRRIVIEVTTEREEFSDEM